MRHATSCSPDSLPCAGESLGETLERFKAALARFSAAPWTLQRLCELLLAPRNQYSQLHKVPGRV